MSSILVVKNAFFNIAAFTITLVVTFLLIPVMLTNLGTVGFGVWSLVRVLMSYASLGDLGLTNSITKFVAENKVNNDSEKIENIIRTSFVIYVIIVLVLFILLLIFKNTITDTFFSTSNEYSKDLDFVLFGSFVIFSMNLIFSVYTSSIVGIQRMDVTNIVTVVYTILNGILVYLALVFSTGLPGLIYANAISTFIAIVLNIYYFYKLFPDIRVFRFKLSLKTFSQLFHYGKYILVGAVANSIHLHYDKLLLSSFLNLVSVSNYEVASRIIQMMRQIPVLILNPLLPAASELSVKESKEEITKLYYSSMKYLVVLLFLIFGFVGFYASPMIKIWLGKSYNDIIVITLQVFILSNFINLLTGPGYFISLGAGKAQYAMYSAVFGLILNIILSYIFLKYFGYYGVVAGTFIALSLAAIVFLIQVHKLMNISWSKFIKIFYLPALAFCIAIFIGVIFSHVTSIQYIQLFVGGIVAVAVYNYLLLKLNYYNEQDKAFFKNVNNKVLEKYYSITVKDYL